MPNYKEAKIYKLVAEGFDPYYGSTTLTLDERFRAFKNTKKKYSCSPFIHLESCHIELVELYPCETRNELMQREKFWIKNNKCINIANPYRTTLEKKLYHRNYMKENGHKYEKVKPTKEKTSEYCKKWYMKKQLYLNWLRDFNL